MITNLNLYPEALQTNLRSPDITFSVSDESATFTVSENLINPEHWAYSNIVTIPCDPYWDNVVLAMHMDGVDNSSTFIDEKGHTVLVYGATVSSARSVFGGASGLFDGTYMLVPYSPDFNIGTQDFTIDGWIYSTTTGTGLNFFSLIDSTSDSWVDRLNIGKNNSDQLQVGIYNSAGSLLNLHGSALPGNQWVHFEFTRAGGIYYLFQDGVLIDSATPALITHDNSGITIGAAYPTSSWWRGNIDDLRFTIGAARHTSNFPVPTQAFLERACTT